MIDEQGELKGAGESKLTKKKLKAVDGFSIFLVSAIITAAVFSYHYYRLAFSGGLSNQAEDWSAFGTFVGGVFGPLVSFVTLLALLRTIFLQKELLQTQQHEFEAMQKLQNDTLQSQLRQFKKADDEADDRTFENGRHKLLTLVDRYASALTKEVENKTKRLDMLAQWIIDGKAPGRQDDVTKINEKLKMTEKQISQLHVLYADIIFDHFVSLDQMKDHFHTRMASIFQKEPDVPPTE